MMRTRTGIWTAVLMGMVLLTAACNRRPDTAAALAGKRVAVLLTEGFQDQEATGPIDYLRDRGAEVVVVGPSVETVSAYNSDTTVTIDKAVGDVAVDDFDALVIPGGKSPARLREDSAVVDFARDFFETGRPVAAICHGPQVLVTAGVMEGKRATGYEEIAAELTDAGVDYEDRPVVRDGNLITSRVPEDVPQFSAAIAEALTDNDEPPVPAVPPAPVAPITPGVPAEPMQ